MAAKYNPKRILQLLQICSWKNKSELNYTGFGNLSNTINALLIKDGLLKEDFEDIKQKYLNELLLDAQKNLESGEPIGKHEFNIERILYFIGIKKWDLFEKKLAIIESYVDLSKIDFSTFKTLNTIVFSDDKLRTQIEPEVNYIATNFQVPLQIADENQNDIDGVLNTVLDHLKETPFIIWCISDKLNDTLNSNIDLPKNQLASGQTIPIRIGKTLDESDLTLSFIDSAQPSSGLIGLLMALSAIDMTLKMKGQSISNSETVFGAKNNMTIQNNSGTIFSGDNLQIKGENVALRDFIQNVNPKSKDDE